MNFIQQQLKATEVFIYSREEREEQGCGGGGGGESEKEGGRGRNGGEGGDGVFDSCLAHIPFHGTDHGAWHSWMLLAPYKKTQAPFSSSCASQLQKAPGTQDHLCTGTEEGGCYAQAGRIDRPGHSWQEGSISFDRNVQEAPLGAKAQPHDLSKDSKILQWRLPELTPSPAPRSWRARASNLIPLTTNFSAYSPPIASWKEHCLFWSPTWT